MKVVRSRDTSKVEFTPAESHVLEQLLEELQDTLEPGALEPSDRVRERLYPAAYADDEDAAAYRELTEAGLRHDRADRADQCLAELLHARTLRKVELALDADAADRWIRVLNDMRLTFGTRLDISEDDDYELDADDPDVHERARYMWLTALQDMLVTSLMG